MNAPNLNVPEPLADDGDDITTALETAAIFNAQGDLREAVRWVRRAAEAAGDAGNDLRALTLARAVADLNIGASVLPVQAAASAPPSASASAVAAVLPAAPPAPVPDAGSSERGSVRPSPVVRVEAAADAPPPPPPLPAAREDAPAALPFPAMSLAPAQPALAVAQPTLAAPPPFPEETDEATPIARPSWPELSPPSATPARSVGNGATQAIPAVAQSPAAPAAAAAPAPAVVASSPAAAPAPVASTPALLPSPMNGNQAIFKAVRASVEATGDKGVFRVTILGASEPASDGAHEALMVFLDPDSNVLDG